MTTVTTSDNAPVHEARRFSLRRNFSWMLLGQAIYSASQWGIVFVLAKLGTETMVGQFTLGLSVTAPIIMFTNLALRSVQATDAKHEFLFADYLTLRLIGTVIALVIIVAIALFGGYQAQTALAIMAIGLAKACEAISDIFFGLQQQYEKMDRIGKSIMIEGPVTLLLMAVIMFLTGNIVIAAAGMALVWFLQLVLYDLYSGVLIFRAEGQAVWRSLRPRLHWPNLLRLSRMALPLGFATMLVSLNFNIPRYFIVRDLGEGQLGIFSALAYILVAEIVLINVLAQTVTPRLAQYVSQNQVRLFSGLLLKLVGIGAIIGGLGVAVALIGGRPLLALLYQPQYAAEVEVFILLMVFALVAIIASFLNFGMVAVRSFDWQPLLFLLAIATTLLACAYLIPLYGLKGAALAQIASSLVQVAGSLIIIVRALRRMTSNPT